MTTMPRAETRDNDSGRQGSGAFSTRQQPCRESKISLCSGPGFFCLGEHHVDLRQDFQGVNLRSEPLPKIYYRESDIVVLDMPAFRSISESGADKPGRSHDVGARLLKRAVA